MFYSDNLIYLDASATTPPHPDVIQEIYNVQKELWGNPSSLHSVGIKALDLLERSRLSIAKKFNVKSDQVIFTSGATESIHLALKGIAPNINPGRIVISSVEHPSVIAAAESLSKYGWIIDYWPVDSFGSIDLSLTDKFLSAPTKMISLIWGQNEVGTLMPIPLIAKECKKRKIYFHTDATQIISQGTFDFKSLGVNSFSASAHKFRGPKGIGFLIIDNEYLEQLIPIQGGGLQENGYRSGTPSVALAHGMAIALELVNVQSTISNNKLIFNDTNTTLLTKKLYESLLKIEHLDFIGDKLNRLPNHISFIVKSKTNQPISARRLVRELSEKGIFVSSGSACSSNSIPKNNVLKSMGIDPKLYGSSIRISLGNWIENLDTNSLRLTISSTIEHISNQS
ncbi:MULTISPECIES: cysteine desulfurase family protein [unclassified Prochlorococcus]|uniref:cysteine desulfurase family protein n=1 Tax=unclassified Prochlorococcus TaxID=2627481 RepID=UPI0005337ADB|nr:MULTISPECIES: aminotransferase class V-fold PLP-dependent enzyme [unclassified Prochlorococcus]KGG15272.1 Cysteine desulfurase [Prochlorococcus sp. MIT 0602]KGG17549.1 Cysteine desulfurase [Prochlorococcus sp. MIT 0603]